MSKSEVVVPVVPTEAMLAAASEFCWQSKEDCAEAWKVWLSAAPTAAAGEGVVREAVPKLKRQYPDYLDDPDGLERFRQDVMRTPGHDMAAVNHNSLGRLIDTIDRLRRERDAALATPQPESGEGEGATQLYTGEEAWEELVEKDDRTSPEEYPDMCLITRDELLIYVDAKQIAADALATPDRASPPADVAGVVEATDEMLRAFAEGVIWNDEQRRAYVQLDAALKAPRRRSIEEDCVSTAERLAARMGAAFVRNTALDRLTPSRPHPVGRMEAMGHAEPLDYAPPDHLGVAAGEARK